MKRRKKRKKKPETMPEPAVTGVETPEPPRPSRGRRGGFFWGLALGFTLTLGVIISGDLGWFTLPGGWSTAAAVPDSTTATTTVSPSVLLAGPLPPGAHVYVDGSPATTSPEGTDLRVTVAPGAKQLEIRGQNVTWWSTRLDAEGTPARLEPVLSGDLVVEVDKQGPAGDLYVDGTARGKAPGTASEVSPGWHVVDIRRGDAVLFEDACQVTPGEVTVLTAPPVPSHGQARLTVRSRVLGDDGFEATEGQPVWVDGKPQGKTPLELTVDAGYHSVRVQGETGAPWVTVMNLDAGSSRYATAEFGHEEKLQVAVEPPAGARAADPLAIPVRVKSDAGTVLLTSGLLYLVLPEQSKPVGLPLVASTTDPSLWVAVIPQGLTRKNRTLVGYASCTDDLGRVGDSDLFRLQLQ